MRQNERKCKSTQGLIICALQRVLAKREAQSQGTGVKEIKDTIPFLTAVQNKAFLVHVVAGYFLFACMYVSLQTHPFLLPNLAVNLSSPYCLIGAVVFDC